MTEWFLEKLEIEGFRGINNHGAPLVLKFATDKVNSIFAKNAIGKSSIFDALSYALRGTVPKLHSPEAGSNGGAYYVNLFHPGHVATIVLTVVPVGGGTKVPITVTRDAVGTRTVTGPAGVDVEAILKELNREFVLLDHDTLRTFIQSSSLNRGRSFSGLLGMARYTDIRGEMQTLTNTRAFNNHYGLATLEGQKRGHVATHAKEVAGVAKEFKAVTNADLDAKQAEADVKVAALAGLAANAVLKSVCDGATFDTVSFEKCHAAISVAEGGPDRAAIIDSLQREGVLTEHLTDGLTEVDFTNLKALAAARDKALAATSGDLLYKLFIANKNVLTSGAWDNDHICAACDGDSGTSQTAHMDTKLGHYAEVKAAEAKIQTEWAARNWSKLKEAEAAVIKAEDTKLADALTTGMGTNSLTEQNVIDLWAWRTEIRERLTKRRTSLEESRAIIEARLPASLVAVTTMVEAARRLRDHWAAAKVAHTEKEVVVAKIARIERIRMFLAKAEGRFSTAESNASKRRLAKIEPDFQAMFKKIMISQVVPKLVKPADSEELSLSLSDFWGLQSQSGHPAQPLLSESFRNALSVSVYLAAAALYGGAPKFIVFDDITSSFDSGHQHLMMELIRTDFAVPMKAAGMQVILLSHDGSLEKLFNKHVHNGGWRHQRLHGTAKTQILTQSVTADYVRDRAVVLLTAGDDTQAEPLIRQFLEFKLLQIIDQLDIPVPLEFAANDGEKTINEALKAIEAAVDLHKAANRLVLEPSQQNSLNINMAAIIANYLAHWPTGSGSMFTVSALQGVIASIDTFAQCFQFEDPPGSGTWKYYKSLSKKV